jgi:AraC family transcriptional regulator, arabinose operon regulatory protein
MVVSQFTRKVLIMNESIAIRHLQEKCIHLYGEAISFRIFFWGAQMDHQDNPLHKHSFFEACYVKSGTGFYYEGGQNYPLKRGAFFCSRPGKLHRIHKGKQLSIYWVGFEVDEENSTLGGINLFKELKEMNGFIVDTGESSPTANLWNTLMMHASSSYSQDLLCSLSHSLLLSLQTLFCGIKDKEDNRNEVTYKNVLIDQAQLFIRDNLTVPLTIEDVAQYLHISSRHLSRLFNHHLGITFTAFIKRERIRASAAKLRESMLPIKEIAEIYCFSSVHYFTRVFTEETSITPGEYRKLNRYNKENGRKETN